MTPAQGMLSVLNDLLLLPNFYVFFRLHCLLFIVPSFSSWIGMESLVSRNGPCSMHFIWSYQATWSDGDGDDVDNVSFHLHIPPIRICIWCLSYTSNFERSFTWESTIWTSSSLLSGFCWDLVFISIFRFMTFAYYWPHWMLNTEHTQR